jgi:FKBP-type peptidyl-prolyl cis-trans isomerase
MLPKTLLFAALVLLAVPGVADVYRYVDANGQVQYTDRPQTLPAEKLDIESRRTDVVALNDRLEAERKRAEEAEETRSLARAETEDEQAARQLTAKEKAEQCMQARERYGKYTSSHRLYEDLGNGQRRYLSDAEIDAARDGARRAMEELCK